jgi:FlaA1/EpsC-like NDP-sugar epimerase
MRTRTFLIFLLFLISDFIAILFSLVISALYSISSYVIQNSEYTLADLDLQYIYLLLCFVWYFSARSTGIYEDHRSKVYSIDVYNILKNIIFQVVCLILILFVIKEQALTRTFVVVYFICATIFIILGKTIVRFALDRLRHKLREVSNVAIIGANALGNNIYKKLYRLSAGYNVIGYIDDEPEEPEDKIILGNLQDLERILSEQQIDLVIVALSKSKMEGIEAIIKVCQNHIVEVKIIPDVASLLAGF